MCQGAILAEYQSETNRAIVVDLGAGSGRVILAELHTSTIMLRELYRFDGFSIEAEGGPAWDFGVLFAGICEGLRRAEPFAPATVGVDSWGLDFALLDDMGRQIAPILQYRHPRSMIGRTAVTIEDGELQKITGGQILPVLTLFQLAGERETSPGRLAQARLVLPVASLVVWHLTGYAAVERSLARTTGLYSLEEDTWHPDLLELAGIPPEVMPPIMEAGTSAGEIITALPGGGQLGPVVLTASHDTAAAVLGLPVDPQDVFLIAGSWNLVGWRVEQAVPPAPLELEAALAAGFGCEGGAGGCCFMVKSFNGLHLMRKLRDAWSNRHGAMVGWDELARLIAAAPDGPKISPSNPKYFVPKDLLAEISADTGMGQNDLGGAARAILAGMAADIAGAVAEIERVRGHPAARIVVGGGGVRDVAFLREVSRATGLEIIRGPVEASATGNALMQFVASGALPDLAAGRALLGKEYAP